MKREDNPFEDESIAKEWISSVENETGLIRDNELYPLLASWVSKVKPQVLVEIGSGQGICSTKLGKYNGSYRGIEPSVPLIMRAREKYQKENREFIVGNAYALPLEDSSVDAIFSINVWFHIGDLELASREAARILKPDGKLLLITANPAKNSAWESMFYEYSKDGNKLDGKVRTPINDLSRNVLFLHELKDITGNLEKVGIRITHVHTFGTSTRYPGDSEFFVAIEGSR